MADRSTQGRKESMFILQQVMARRASTSSEKVQTVPLYAWSGREQWRRVALASFDTSKLWRGTLNFERHLNATAKSHAASCTKGYVLQVPTCIGEKGIVTATAGPWKQSVLGSEGKRAVANAQCCKLFYTLLHSCTRNSLWCQSSYLLPKLPKKSNSQWIGYMSAATHI